MFGVFKVLLFASSSSPSRRAPSEVVAAQMDALQAGDAMRVFDLASPRNKEATGPVQRFAAMLATYPYKPMLRCSRWEFLSALQISTDSFISRVRVYPAGASVAAFAVARPSLDYEFRLSNTTGAWLTDSVVPVIISGA